MSGKIRLLIVAADLNVSAPGIVYRNILNALCKFADCTVISHIDAGDRRLNSLIDIVDCPQYNLNSWSQIKCWWKKYRMNLKDEYWSWMSFSRTIFRLMSKKFDCVLSLTSMNYFGPLKLGSMIARFFYKKWIIYSVDGIPSPVEWLDDSYVHSVMSTSLDAMCRRADLFFSSNPHMLTYQQKILRHFHGKWSYLFTPFTQNTLGIRHKKHSGFVFLYLGSLYGLRRVDGLIDAFRKFLLENTDSKLVFVGNVAFEYFSEAKDLIEQGCIELHSFQEDITKYYEQADVLLDIAADIPNDIFLSSKIISYLPIDLPIISISGDNSPVRDIMVDDTSIFHAHNTGNEIFECMNRATQFNDIINRDSLLELFNPDNIAQKLVNDVATVLLA